MERLKTTIQRAGLVALLSFNAACVEGSNQQIREAKTDSRPLEQPVNLPEPEYILVREEIPTPQIIWPTSTPEPSLTPTLTPKPTLTSTPTRTPTKIPTPTLTPSPTSTPKLLPTATSVKEAEAPVPVLITHGNQNRKRISATFDCGSADQNLAPILQALRERGVKTTFFITGEFARKYPASLKQIAADGHEVGNHSNTHPDFTPLSNEGMIDQLKNAEKSISSITGKSTKPWMRFPYGAYNGHTLRIVYEAGYRAVGWTIDSGDWHEDWSAQTVRDNYLRAGKINGAIIVGHCHSWQSAQVLGNVLQIWIGQGIEVVPISQVIQ